MSESTEPHPEKERKWPARLAKITFCVIAILLIAFTVMANMGGSNDTLKGAIEQYLLQSTGYPTKIQTLNRMSFFPNIGFDVANVEMRRQPGDNDPAIMVGKIKIAMSFWDTTLGTGKIKQFEIEELSALPGAIIPQALYLEKAHINDAGQGDAALFEGFGQIGQTDLTFQSDLKAFGRSGHRKYAFPAQKNFTLALNDLGIQGTINWMPDQAQIENLRVRMPEKVFDGAITIKRLQPQIFHITGLIEAQDRTNLAPDLTWDRSKTPATITGTVISQIFNTADFAQGSAPQRFSQDFMAALGMETQSLWALPNADISIDLKIKKLVANSEDKGPLETRITYQGGQLNLGGLQDILKAEPAVTPAHPQFGPFLQDVE